MLKKIEQLIKISLILLLIITLFIAVLTIWNFIDGQTAKEIFIKIIYTFSAVFVVFLGVIYSTKSKK